MQTGILAEKAIKLGKSLLNRILPESCVLCSAHGQGALCPHCAADLPALDLPGCPVCALPGTAGQRCGQCLKQPPAHDRALALYRYAFPLDRMIQALKYGHALPLAHLFGHMLGERLALLPPGTRIDRVVPLPLHPERLRARGFNQALEIARPLARLQRLALDPHCCIRTRATPPQVSLDWEKRTRNMRRSFATTADLNGEHILLIDDVMTTGASAQDCARALKAAGAASVTLAVVARTLPHDPARTR